MDCKKSQWMSKFGYIFTCIRHSFIKNSSVPKYSIIGQEFTNGSTIFILFEHKTQLETRQAAQILYAKKQLLEKFSREDLIIIVSTAIQEQTIADMSKLYQHE